jgi:hypothetical protein
VHSWLVSPWPASAQTSALAAVGLVPHRCMVPSSLAAARVWPDGEWTTTLRATAGRCHRCYLHDSYIRPIYTGLYPQRTGHVHRECLSASLETFTLLERLFVRGRRRAARLVQQRFHRRHATADGSHERMRRAVRDRPVGGQRREPTLDRLHLAAQVETGPKCWPIGTRAERRQLADAND